MKEKINKDIEIEPVGIVYVNEKICDAIIEMVSKLNLKGKTHISFTEGLDHLPISVLGFNESEKVDDMFYSVRDMKYYKSYMDAYNSFLKKEFKQKWDNDINVIVYQEEGYEINRMIVTTKKDCFMAIIAYPKEKSKDVSEWQFTKRLKPYM